MSLLSSLRTAMLAATATLISAGAQAGPMPTNVAAMKSMVDQSTTEVRWRGGYGYRGVGFRGGGGYGYRGGYGYQQPTIAAGMAIAVMAIAASLRRRGQRHRRRQMPAAATTAAMVATMAATAAIMVAIPPTATRPPLYYGYDGGLAMPGGGYGYGSASCPPYGGYAAALLRLVKSIAPFPFTSLAEAGAAKQRPARQVLVATLFRKAFHIKGNDDLRRVGLTTYALDLQPFLAWLPLLQAAFKRRLGALHRSSFENQTPRLEQPPFRPVVWRLD